MPQITSKYTRSSKVHVTCRRCLQPGHTVARCNTPDEDCECAYCHEIGHTKYNCPVAMEQHQKRKTAIGFVRMFERFKTNPAALNDLKKEHEGFSEWMEQNVKEYDLPEEKIPEPVIEEEDSSENEKFECEHCGKIGDNLGEMEDHEMSCPKKKKKARKKKKKETMWPKEEETTKSTVVFDIRTEMGSETKQRVHLPRVRKKEMRLLCM